MSITNNEVAQNNLRNLKGLRERYGLSLEDLASIAECQPAELQAYEEQQEIPPDEVYDKLADYFKWAHSKPSNRPNSSRYFSNTSCEYYPCHPNAKPENFSCLFCYCPLYGLTDCGGTPTYLAGGLKDCTNCLRPHEDYDGVIQRLREEMQR